MTKRTGARQRIVFGRRESEGKSGECCFLWGNGREHGGGGGGVVSLILLSDDMTDGIPRHQA